MPPPRPKVPPYLLMLVVSFALVGLIGYQTLKDRKITGDLLLENTTLKELLKEEKKKATELHKKFMKLSTQKEELNGLKEGLSGQLIELDRVKSLTEEGKKKLESSLSEKEDEIKDLKAKLALFHEKEEELKLRKKESVQKDNEINDLKARLQATGKYSSEGLRIESTDPGKSGVEEDEEKHEKQEPNEKDVTSSGKGFVEREKESSDGNEEIEGAKTRNDHNEEHAWGSKKKTETQIMDNEDDEPRVDDREDTGEEADAEKTHDEEETERTHEEETEKAHEEEETEEQPDVDMDVVNKADLEENELAAME